MSEALGVAEAARRIRAGTLSAEALVRACLERIGFFKTQESHQASRL